MRTLALFVALATLLAARPARADSAVERLRLLDVQLSVVEQPPLAEQRPVQRSVVWAILPFGLGQLANDQPVKGGLLCAAEIVAFGTFAAALAAFEANKTSGEPFKWGTFKDTNLARNLQTTYLVAFWTGVALVAVGLIDALVFRPTPDTTVAVGPGAVAASF